MENGNLVAYLLGAYADSIFFGRHVWVPFGGLALADQENTELIRRIYAAAGQQWIDDRVLNHYLVCPAIPAWLQAGYSLTFGQEQAYAITSVKETRPEVAPPEGIILREVASFGRRPTLCQGSLDRCPSEYCTGLGTGPAAAPR